MIEKIALALATFAAVVSAVAWFPDMERARWIDRPGFVGIRFVVDGSRCRAGSFGRDPDLAGIACEGDPWATR